MVVILSWAVSSLSVCHSRNSVLIFFPHNGPLHSIKNLQNKNQRRSVFIFRWILVLFIRNKLHCQYLQQSLRSGWNKQSKIEEDRRELQIIAFVSCANALTEPFDYNLGRFFFKHNRISTFPDFAVVLIICCCCNKINVKLLSLDFLACADE